MGSNIRIGIIYSWDENWIGGTYYIQNLMNAIYEANPETVFKVYVNKSVHINTLKKMRYFKNIEFEIIPTLSIYNKVINKFFRFILQKAPYATDPDRVSTVYPGPGGSFFFDVQHKIYWIPDLQDCHHPEFFDDKELNIRRNFRNVIIVNNFPIIFSSQNACDDFKKFHPEARNTCFILKFAVTPPDLSGIKKDALLEKYGISENYFICSNQFWKHKNHKVLLEAFKEAREERKDLQLILTGKESDHRNMEYVEYLKKQIEVTARVTSLGFIDRLDQIGLMKYSIAIVQPSLFEGWGTVVEDAKALGKHVLLSDIPIHREQMTENCTFFNPSDSDILSDQILSLVDKKLDYDPNSYRESFKTFGQDYLNILEQL